MTNASIDHESLSASTLLKASQQKQKILGFNGLRGTSIVCVYLSHKCGLEFYAGALGVWTFLTLSGFLIIGELHRQRIGIEANDYGIGAGLKTFFMKRAIRIFPAYYGLIAVLFLFRHFYSWVGSDLGFRYHLIYLSNYWIVFVSKGSGPFGVLWSLSIEQQFYVFAPFLFLLTPSRKHLLVCFIVIAIMAAGQFAMSAYGVDQGALYLVSPWNYATIVLGGLGYLLLQKPYWRRVIQSAWTCAISCATISVFALSWLEYRVHDPQQSLAVFTTSVALAALVCWISVRQNSLAVRALEWRPLEYLGVISYGFYLIHNFIPNPLGKVIFIYFGVTISDTLKITLGASFGFAISVLLAHLSWKYWERPLLGYKHQLVTRAAAVQSGSYAS